MQVRLKGFFKMSWGEDECSAEVPAIPAPLNQFCVTAGKPVVNLAGNC